MTTERSLRANRIAPLVLTLIVMALTSVSLSAHRRDEYLQAARLAVEPDRVELQLDLTPGIDVADAIIGDIDRDRDGALSAREQQAYVGRVFGLLELHIDGHALAAEPDASTFPDLGAVRRGEGTIRLRSTVSLPHVSSGAHQLVFRNRHRPDVSVYLANALIPDGDRVAITAQRRDSDQRELTIDYTVRAQRALPAPAWLGGILSTMLLVALRARR
jgi:hypothetical protein